jgi:pheromone shutdown protein TraB
MLFDRPLTDALIRYLSIHRSATILELFDHVQSVEQISRPNFYKIIGQLVDRQLLAKDEKKLQLNEYLDLAHSMEQTFDNSPTLRRLAVGETQQFTAHSLWEIDSIYGDIYLRIIKWTQPSVLYHYQSH